MEQQWEHLVWRTCIQRTAGVFLHFSAHFQPRLFLHLAFDDGGGQFWTFNLPSTKHSGVFGSCSLDFAGDNPPHGWIDFRLDDTTFHYLHDTVVYSLGFWIRLGGPGGKLMENEDLWARY